METAKFGSKSDRLSDIYSDLFTLIIYLRRTSDFGEPKVLHDRIDGLFKSSETKAKELNVPDEDIQNSKYAIAALIDETVLYSNWPQRNVWLSNPLVVEYFNDALAGEVFFQKMDIIRNDPSRTAVLEIYYISLLFGFEGRYKIQGYDELRNYMNEVKKQLDYKSSDRLSPHPEIPKQPAKPRSVLPRWVIASSYILLALVGIAIFIVFKAKMIVLANYIVNGIRSI